MLKPIGKYRVNSKSRPGKKHLVVEYDTFMECDCEAFHYKKDCSHIKKVIEYKYGKTKKPTRPSNGEDIRQEKNQ